MSKQVETHQQQQQQCKVVYPTPYLIITNISKRQNIKSLLQRAVAYGITTIFVVGQRAFNFDIIDSDSIVQEEDGTTKKTTTTTDIPPTIQYHIRSKKLKIIKFDKLEECITHIKSIQTSTPIQVLGVEIDKSSINLETEPFIGSTAFMMGNEGSGMTEKQMSVCDGFIRISQYGGGTASLNVSVAAGLVLHRFYHWSKRQE